MEAGTNNDPEKAGILAFIKLKHMFCKSAENHGIVFRFSPIRALACFEIFNCNLSLNPVMTSDTASIAVSGDTYWHEVLSPSADEWLGKNPPKTMVIKGDPTGLLFEYARELFHIPLKVKAVKYTITVTNGIHSHSLTIDHDGFYADSIGAGGKGLFGVMQKLTGASVYDGNSTTGGSTIERIVLKFDVDKVNNSHRRGECGAITAVVS